MIKPLLLCNTKTGRQSCLAQRVLSRDLSPSSLNPNGIRNGGLTHGFLYLALIINQDIHMINDSLSAWLTLGMYLTLKYVCGSLCGNYIIDLEIQDNPSRQLPFVSHWCYIYKYVKTKDILNTLIKEYRISNIFIYYIIYFFLLFFALMCESIEYLMLQTSFSMSYSLLFKLKLTV